MSKLYQHLAKGAVWTLNDGAFRHPIIFPYFSIQYPVEDPGFFFIMVVSILTTINFIFQNIQYPP